MIVMDLTTTLRLNYFAAAILWYDIQTERALEENRIRTCDV